VFGFVGFLVVVFLRNTDLTAVFNI
jgi:hypothetical protein